MNILKRFAAVGSIGLLALAGSAIADPLYNQTLPAPGFYNGTGVGADSFTTNDANGISLGLSIKTQFGIGTPTVEDTNSNNYVAPTELGSHSYAGGTINYTDLASWDYYFSVNTGSTASSAYDYLVTLEDVNTGDTFSYNPLSTLGDNTGLNPVTGLRYGNGVSDPAEVGFQNAENIAFNQGASNIALPSWVSSNGAISGDIFLVTLAALDKTTGATLDSVAVTVNAPEPGTYAMMLGSLGVLGLLARRRRTN